MEGNVHHVHNGWVRVAAVAAVAALGACHARLSGGAPDGARSGDAQIDGPTRPCTGGDGHATDNSGNCYVFFLGPKIWLDAKAACEALPGHLAKITNGGTNTVVAGLANGHATFFGGNDRAIEGTFVWTDGTPVQGYTHFRTGVPDNGGGLYEEDCLVIEGNKTPNDTWDDRPCDPSQVPTSGNFPYVCEY